LIAPLVPGVVGTALDPPSKAADLPLFALMCAVVYIYSFILMTLLAVPAYLFLRKNNLVRWWSALLTGLALGCLMGIIFRLPNQPQIGDIFRMGFMGASAGFVFWLIWSRGVDPAVRN
jgi:hypothetical protein